MEGLTGAGAEGAGVGATPPAPAKEVTAAPLALIQRMEELDGVVPESPGLPGLMMLQQQTFLPQSDMLTGFQGSFFINSMLLVLFA